MKLLKMKADIKQFQSYSIRSTEPCRLRPGQCLNAFKPETPKN